MRPLALSLLALSFAASTAVPADAARVLPKQELVTLLKPHDARLRPTLQSPRILVVSARRPITGQRTVLPVLARTDGPNGTRWLHVRLPGRPNGHTGWIRERATVTTSTPWHVVVITSSRRVVVYRSGRLVRTFSVIVGKPSTPTPHGEFFVEEAVELTGGEVGAPYALALSARSNVLQEFAGGPGQIALHGLANVGGRLGTAVSHGCVRMDGSAMRWLVTQFGFGVPVTIR
jgi:lipoprotein-anchoring transpeptidase ErfK/SrfK